MGHIEEDNELGFKKSDSVAMSRTTGIAGFLSPIHVGLHKGKNRNNKNYAQGSIDDLSDEEVTEYNEIAG